MYASKPIKRKQLLIKLQNEAFSPFNPFYAKSNDRYKIPVLSFYPKIPNPKIFRLEILKFDLRI